MTKVNDYIGLTKIKPYSFFIISYQNRSKKDMFRFTANYVEVKFGIYLLSIHLDYQKANSKVDYFDTKKKINTYKSISGNIKNYVKTSQVEKNLSFKSKVILSLIIKALSN